MVKKTQKEIKKYILNIFMILKLLTTMGSRKFVNKTKYKLLKIVM